MKANRIVRGLVLTCLVLGGGCMSSEDPLDARARALAAGQIILDGHIDVPYRLRERMEDVSRRTEHGDFDYPRAREGGLNVPFMSIYIPAEYEETGGAKELADELIDMVEGFAAEHPERFSMVHSVADARAVLGTERIGLALGMENGAPIEGDLANLEHFRDRGVRYITLTHSENNHICDSSYADERQWNGLSPFGRELVAAMNRLGIMIDVSHVSDDSFYQVMELSRAPVIASHSSCRAYTPDWERNMDDDMIRLLARKGGVIQINFGSAFLRGDSQKQSSLYWNSRRAFLDEHGYADDSDESKQFGERFWSESPRIYADLSDVVAHIDHVVGIAGIDHVGLGSDFDGVGDSLPTGLKDVSQYPNLIRELLRKDYSDEDVTKILGGNVLRVWAEVEALAGA